MITRPASSQVLHTICEVLRERVAAAVNDPQVLTTLGMIDSMLTVIAAQCDHEVGWMREEITEIEGAAAAILDADADSDGRLAEGMTELETKRSNTFHTADVQQEYNAAGEVLSRAIECALRAEDRKLRDAVDQVFEARLSRELEIRGAFALKGRT